MVKAFISSVIIAFILLTGSLVGDAHVTRKFNEFNGAVKILYRKVSDETAVEDDVYCVQNLWISEKKSLHVFISHTEIKEMDLWISECASLVKNKKWEDAISKVEVILELTEQIPKGFKFSVENIL